MSFGAHFIPAAQRTARSDGEDTRVRLLRAALQLFSERGFAQTSVRSIAEAAGTNVAAIAYHFGDKARLYTATFYEPFGSGSDLIPVFADPALTLQQALAAYFGGFLEPLKHDDLVTQSLRLHVRELLDPTHVWPELIERECRAPHLALVQVLCRHMGVAAADDDMHRLAFSLAGLVMQMWTQRDPLQAIAPPPAGGGGVGGGGGRGARGGPGPAAGGAPARPPEYLGELAKGIQRMPLGKTRFFWATCLPLALGAGAITAPPAQVPTAPPVAWQAPLPPQGSPGGLTRWWTQLGDPLLVELIDAAQAVSPGVAQAQSRIAQARATQVASRAALLPSLDAQASASRGFNEQLAGIATTAQAGLQASWEIDLFGANRATKTAADERLAGAQALWHEARVSVAAEVAQQTSSLRTCLEQLRVAERDAA